jgi:hypothetical protein
MCRLTHDRCRIFEVRPPLLPLLFYLLETSILNKKKLLEYYFLSVSLLKTLAEIERRGCCDMG